MAFDKNEQGVEQVDDHLVRVKVDEHVINPDSELAVQVPEEVQNRDNVLDVHRGDAPEDIFAAASEEAAAEREAQADDESKSVDQPEDDKDSVNRDQ